MTMNDESIDELDLEVERMLNAINEAASKPQQSRQEFLKSRNEKLRKAAILILSIGLIIGALSLSSWIIAPTLNFAVTLIYAATALMCSVFGSALFLYPAASWIVYDRLLKWINSFSEANKLALSENGLKIYWPSQLRESLRWDQITSVFLFRPSDSMLPENWLVGFGTSKAQPVKIKMSVVEAVGPQLLELLQSKCRWASIDPDLIELWEPRLSGSNNELWLKSLSSAPKEAELMPLYPGDFVAANKYQIIFRIGVGGQGTAYLAKDCSEDKDIVLKETLFPVYVDPDVRAKAEARYKNEVAMLARLDNPHVVRMLDSFVEEHRGYLVLEYIDGLSLRQLVKKEGALKESRVVELAIEMAKILKYIHELSPPLVHRDFTPENLLLEKDGRLVLIDFNVARQIETTKTATVVGKHAYIPPEQFRGDADARSDIYAFGATLYFLLCAEDPEPIAQSFPAEQNSSISSRLNELVGKATALDMSDRYTSAEDILVTLYAMKEDGVLET